MKNIFLLIAIVSLSITSYGQKRGKKEIITYTAKDGTVFTLGDTIHFGIGSNPNGNFRYIYTVKTVWQNGAFYNSSLNGKFATIDEMKESGSDKMGYTTYFGFRYPAGKSGINVESAIASGEVVTPASKKKAKESSTPVIIQQNNSSLADEILKLKELLDLGVLTKEEYEAQKTKLLNK